MPSQRHQEEWNYEYEAFMEKRRRQRQELPRGKEILACEFICILWEGDTKMGLDIQETHEGEGVGKESSHLMQV